ncbi:MAG: ATP-binding protein [Syntrophales bacterium]|nr:ATP-binding protein [Syntrophales bacterium]
MKQSISRLGSTRDKSEGLFSLPKKKSWRIIYAETIPIVQCQGQTPLHSQTAADDLREVILDRYRHRKSTIITSNRPIEDWGKLLDDNAGLRPFLTACCIVVIF